MGLILDDKLVVGISSRALFDLEEENSTYRSCLELVPAARVPYKQHK